MADKIVQLIDKDGDNVYPVAGSLAADTVDTNNIVDEAVTSSKIDFTTFGNQTSYFDLGNIRVVFGSGSLSVPNNQETSTPAISYGVAFASTPQIVVTVKGWLPLKLCVTNNANTETFRVVLNQNFGATLTVGFDWVAIGIKSTN